jgi:hypothetical protein
VADTLHQEDVTKCSIGCNKFQAVVNTREPGGVYRNIGVWIIVYVSWAECTVVRCAKTTFLEPGRLWKVAVQIFT